MIAKALSHRRARMCARFLSPRVITMVAFLVLLTSNVVLVAQTPDATNTLVGTGCGDAPAIDQHGVSVDVWAPGVRIACGYGGYENGDNPMPAGTPFDPPRPFRFDQAVDHNEPVYGFKVFYWTGDAHHCGDQRMILHMATDTHGPMTRFHTLQMAYAQCNPDGTKSIIDVGGQVDTGPNIYRERGDFTHEPLKQTATTSSCVNGQNAAKSGDCGNAWYVRLTFDVPGVNTAAEMGFSMETTNPIILIDPDDPMAVHPTGHGFDGVSRSVGDTFVRYLTSPNGSKTWTASFDAATGHNTAVPPGTPGSWIQRVDPGFNAGPGAYNHNTFNGNGQGHNSHGNPEKGIVYPN